MTVERTDTLIVGGGQSGIAMTEHLTDLSIPHIVLERGCIVERGHSECQVSLVANGRASNDPFPGMPFSDIDPDEIWGYLLTFNAMVGLIERTVE